jgi:hypothetical protein
MIDQILEILFEEDNPRIVAIYGGGFKPPTKGHFAVVEKTLSEFPEIDELIVYVGGGVRDGITQEESIKIWEIYKNYLSPKVKVLPSIAPVKSVLDYAKENPTDKVYWVLGAREGDEDDIKDIENRTRSVEKYPNLEVKVITTKGGVSGTKTRQAIKAGNKEQFFHFIPDVEEKEEIWNLVIPVVKEIKNKRAEIIKAKKAKMEAKKSLEEGFIENTQENMKKLFLAIKQEGKETRDAFKLVLQATKGEIQLTDEQKKQIGDQLKDVLRTIGLVSIAALPGGFIVGALIKIFKAERLVFPSSLMSEVGEASAKVYSYKSNISPEWLFYKADNYFKDNSIKKSYTDQLIYTFSTGKAKYIVQIPVEMEKQTYINFSRNSDWKPGPPYKTYARVDFTTEGNPDEKATNLNEQFSVLSTITNIVIDFISKFNEAGGNIILMNVFPKADSDEGSKIDSKRGKLYAAYIKKNLSKIPGYNIRENTSSEGNEYVEIYKTNSVNELEEGKQVGSLYHYTSADGLKGILQSNKINASEENYLGNELYYISFTRNKNFHKKGSKFGVQTEYRITLDGDKLSNKYKIRPFAYIPGWDIEDSWELDWLDDEPESVRRDFFNATGDYDEQEERIFFKNGNGGIDNIKNYILAVDKVEDLQEGRKKKPDPKKGTGKKPEGSGRRLYTDEDPKDTVSIKFKTKEDIVDTLNKASFKAKSHARQSQIINLIHQRVRAAYGKAKDPEVKSRLKRALDYIESRKEASKEKTERLRKMKEASDPQAGTALPYGSGFAPVKEKNDPFGLNELAKDFVKEVFEETWNPKDSFVSLTKYMIDNGMNIKPLPKIKVIDNDAENASRLLGKTAHYDPAEKSITLFTMNRHPKDVLRSFAHEMIHHEQNLENRLGSITTTNTNEDGDLPEIEREAYEKGNMMLRNWEDSIKSSVNEIYFLDIPKFNHPKTFIDNLRESLHEITLNPSNAVEIEGDEFEGEFKVGDIEYTYFIDYIDSPYGGESDFYSIAFDEKYNTSKNIPTGNAKENYIKILSTMYKIILNFTQSQKPEYIGIASMDNMGSKNYHTIYANLTDNKSNRIPGYFRKDVNLPFNTPQGKGRMVVLKRKDV